MRAMTARRYGLGIDRLLALGLVQLAPVFEVRDRLPGIRVPTIVIVGRKDFVCSLAMARMLDALIPDSRLVVLERSGHMGHIEEPQAFARAVTGLAAR